jgi:mono/diheme cytochrome c family protein
VVRPRRKEKYNAYCSSCHGPEGRGGLEEDVHGASASKIRKAIQHERDMQFLNFLKNEDINDIASYLNNKC